jgi:poly-gamma-glutamate capsule biosynthesis protein CapA/YwtB (metallophosphatase superfamily)
LTVSQLPGCSRRALVILWLISLTPLGCGAPASAPTSAVPTSASDVASRNSARPCLAVAEELWEDERELFADLAKAYSGCPAGPAGGSSEALAWLRSGDSQLALVSGPSPGEGAELVRTEPYALVAHVASPLDNVTLAWLRSVFQGAGDHNVVLARGRTAVKELLEVDHLRPDAIHVSSWEEATERVAQDRGALALVPWRVVDFHVRALAIDGQAIGPGDPESYPYQRRWWLIGDMEGHQELCQALGEGLARQTGPLISLVAVGDVMLGRGVGRLMAANSPHYPFLLTRELTNAADVAFANLECPLTLRGGPQGGIALRADPEAVEGLSDAGFDVLSLANNHSDDYGAIGLLDTIAALEEKGIAHVGVEVGTGAPRSATVIDAGGARIAFLAYNHVEPRYRGEQGGVHGPVWLEPEVVYDEVGRARDQADIVVVSFHWGTEYIPVPDAFQQEVARRTVEAGAHLVLGHHPHVVGGVAFLEQGFVAYSLGNFIFDQPFSVETEQGLMLRALLDHTGLKQIRLVPVHIEAGQARVPPQPESTSALAEVFEIAESLGDLPGDLYSMLGDEKRCSRLALEWTAEVGEKVNVLRTNDLDADGESEVLVGTGRASGPGRVYALGADGERRWDFATGDCVESLVAGDLDGDAMGEIIVSSGVLDKPGSIHAVDHDGQLRWRHTVEAAVLDTALGDVDSDGQLEVAAGEWGSFGDTIYLLDGDGSLRWKYPTGGSVSVVRVADLDGDGRAEVLAGAENAYLLTGEGRLLWKYPTASFVHHLAVGSEDTDSRRPILVTTGYPDSSLLTFSDRGELSWGYTAGSSPTEVLAADVEGNGATEVLVALMDGRICLLGGDGSLRWEYQARDTVNDLALADVDGDGVKELVAATGDYFSSGGVWVLDVVSGAVCGFYEGLGWVTTIDLVDVDQDGADEIAAGTGGGDVLLLRWGDRVTGCEG